MLNIILNIWVILTTVYMVSFHSATILDPIIIGSYIFLIFWISMIYIQLCINHLKIHYDININTFIQVCITFLIIAVYLLNNHSVQFFNLPIKIF